MLSAFASEVGIFGIGLRVQRDIFARRHGHRTGYQSRDTGQQDVAMTSVNACAGTHARGSNTEHQAARRHDAVVGTKHSRA